MSAPIPRPARAPSASLPLSYLLAATVAFVAAAFGIVWLAPELAGHYYHPRVVALAHTVTLGWITLTIMGASYQLIPIVLQRQIWSERLARWQLAILVLSIAGVVAHFYVGTWPGLVTAAALLAIGIVAHLVNVALTLRGFKQWNMTAVLIVAAYAGLALTVVFGLALGIDRTWPFLPGQHFARLHAHVHLALLGWITPMVFGVAARVYPMFLLAPEPSGWPARAQCWGLIIGVPTLVVGLLGVPMLVTLGSLGVGLAVLGHAVWVIRMARQRKRPQLDWGLRFVLTGTVFLVPATGLGLGFALDLFSGPRLGLAYAIVALGGWVSLTVAGMMLKIVPFLVWYLVYGPHAGKRRVPTLPELAWPKSEACAYAFLTAGMALLPIAVVSGDPSWINAAGMVVTVGALAFATSIGHVLRHLAERTASIEGPTHVGAHAG